MPASFIIRQIPKAIHPRIEQQRARTRNQGEIQYIRQTTVMSLMQSSRLDTALVGDAGFPFTAYGPVDDIDTGALRIKLP